MDVSLLVLLLASAATPSSTIISKWVVVIRSIPDHWRQCENPVETANQLACPNPRGVHVRLRVRLIGPWRIIESLLLATLRATAISRWWGSRPRNRMHSTWISH